MPDSLFGFLLRGCYKEAHSHDEEDGRVCTASYDTLFLGFTICKMGSLELQVDSAKVAGNRSLDGGGLTLHG